jgi:uncharacterized membrane protein YidH (DUF202 family)
MASVDPVGEHEGGGDAKPPAGEGGRRVRLANERTYLAWGRTSLAFFALALAVGRIVPTLERVRSRWPFEVIGCAYAALGVAVALYGLYRHREVEDAVRAGGFAGPSARLLAALSVLTAVVGMATFVVLIIS